MLSRLTCTCVFIACVVPSMTALGRIWSSENGHYKMEAELISFSKEAAVLKRPTGELVAVVVKELSKEDQEYLNSKETQEKASKSASELQTWTTANGMKVRGRVLAFGKKNLVVQRKLGKVHIGDTMFSELDGLHQKVILKILSELEKTEIEDERQLVEWAKSLGGQPKTYPLEGVLLKLESGDEIGVPFFLFSEDDLAILQPGWELWLSKHESEEEQAHESFLVRSAAMAYQQDRAAKQEIEMLKLNMLGAAVGVTAIWKVGLRPANGGYGRPMSIMVSAQNSTQAAAMALQRNPGYAVLGVSRVSR